MLPRGRRYPVFIALFMLGFGTLGLAGASWASRYDNLYVFGDSLSDTGNAFAVTQGTIPVSPPYYAGRFTNGPNYIDDLAGKLGLTAAPSLLGGTNYAFGGAKTGQAAPGDLLTQIEAFHLGHTVADTQALYVVFAGANDLRELTVKVALGLGTPAETTLLVQNIATAISSLAALGAKTFLVPNLPNMGNIPEALHAAPGVSALATALSIQFNTTLASTLDALEQELDLDIRRLDTFTALSYIADNQSAMGLTNVTDACLVGGPETGGMTYHNPDHYLFWDTMHPTARGHALLAEQASQLVTPEPGTLLLLGTGLLGVLGYGWSRRRRG